MPRIALIAYAAALTICATSPALAQLNNICGSSQGLCVVNMAPVGSPCGCRTPYGAAPGMVIAPNGGYPQQQAPLVSNVCRTYRGICKTYPAPVGSNCGCYGDPGTVVLQ